MPLFQYKAISPEGKEVAGVIDADSLTICKQRLRKEKTLVTSIKELHVEKKRFALSLEQLQAFTRELAQLLKAGLPLYESLLTIEEKHRRAKNHPLFADLCDRLRTGTSLSTALSHYPATFSPIYLSMVRSAEASGALHEAFEHLESLLSKQQKLKKQLSSALAYPAFLGSFCFLVIIGLFFFVIPSMEELFEDRSLHPLTSAVLYLSQFLRGHLGVIVAGLGVVIGGIVASARVSFVKQEVEKLLLKTPYISKVIKESVIIRLFRMMHMLLEGGVPLVSAIAYAKGGIKAQVMQELLTKVEKEVTEGKKMSQLFAGSSFMPPLVSRMLAIGEETGAMSSMMGSIAEIYEEELDKDLAQLMTFLQPALLLFLGLVVGLVVLSILLPLTDVSSFVSV